MLLDFEHGITSFRVDGGGTANNFLMQFQADILGVPLEKPAITEMTAAGAGWLAGLAVGIWEDMDHIADQWKLDKVFEPKMSKDQREELYAGWKKAVDRSRGWAEK